MDVTEKEMEDALELARAEGFKFAKRSGKFEQIEDIKQELCLAVVKASKTYDRKRGAKFTSFAWFLIKRRICRMADEKPDILTKAHSIDFAPEKAVPSQNSVETDDFFKWCLGFLGQKNTVTLRLAFESGHDSEEIGKMFGVCGQAVRDRKKKSLAKVKNELVKEGILV